MRGRPILHLLERLLLVAGLLLVGVYTGASTRACLLQAWDGWRFDRALEGRPAPVSAFLAHALHVPAAESLLVTDRPDQSDWSAERIRAYEETEGRASPGMVGRLEVPSIDLRVMVLEGTDEWTLNRGVGRIPGTAEPGEAGNLGIAGHRDGYFRTLRKLTPGERIVLRTTRGLYEYRVEDIEIVRPDEVEVLRSTNRPTLTLVTCYPFYYVGNAPQRYVVKANLVQSVEGADPSGEAARTRAAAGTSSR